MVTYSSHLLLSVHIIEELEDVSPSVSLFGLKHFWKFHVKVILDEHLGVRLDEVY